MKNKEPKVVTVDHSRPSEPQGAESGSTMPIHHSGRYLLMPSSACFVHSSPKTASIFAPPGTHGRLGRHTLLGWPPEDYSGSKKVFAEVHPPQKRLLELTEHWSLLMSCSSHLYWSVASDLLPENAYVSGTLVGWRVFASHVGHIDDYYFLLEKIGTYREGGQH